MNRSSKTARTLMSVFASLAAITLSAHGAVVVAAPASGDIFLGFRASDGQGNATSYLVNLGQYSQFRDAEPGSTITLNLGNIGADLSVTYGDNWNTRGDLFWGIFGVSPSANPALYASKERSSFDEASDPWLSQSSGNRTSTANQITPVLQGLGGYQGSLSTDNSDVGVLQTNSSSASSYYKQVATAGTTDFGTLSGWSSIEGDFGSGTSDTALDLYRIASTGVTSPGYFTISDSGVVTFTAAVPEPSVSIAAAAGLLLTLSCRRRPQSL